MKNTLIIDFQSENSRIAPQWPNLLNLSPIWRKGNLRLHLLKNKCSFQIKNSARCYSAPTPEFLSLIDALMLTKTNYQKLNFKITRLSGHLWRKMSISSAKSSLRSKIMLKLNKNSGKEEATAISAFKELTLSAFREKRGSERRRKI